MVSYPQTVDNLSTGQETGTQAYEASLRNLALCPSHRHAPSSEAQNRDTSNLTGTQAGHIFQTMCPSKNPSVSNTYTALQGHKGHISTTYRPNTKMRAIRPLGRCTESNCDPCVPCVPVTKSTPPTYPQGVWS